MNAGLLNLLKGLGGLGLTAGAGYIGSKLGSPPPGLSLPAGSVNPNTGASPPSGSPGNNPSTPGGGNTYPPQPTPTPTGNQDFGQLEALIRLAQESQRREAKENREFYPQRTAIDFADFERREAIARANTLERQRERTSRETELATISAWQKITEANINRDTQLAYGMMNLSATLGMPNPNVLTALSPVTQQAIAAFKPGTPV